MRTGRFDAVIFDWGGTLTPWHDIDARHCWSVVAQDGELAERLQAAETQIWIRSRDDHYSGTVEQVFGQAGLVPTEAHLRRYYDWWDAHTLTDPEAPAVLAALRERGLKVGVLSNTLWPRVEHERIFTRDAVHHLIDAAVYSSELERTKPHPDAFHAALTSVGVSDPARAVFVGDRLFDDIHGAQQVGMATVYVPHSDVPSWQRTGVEGVPDAVIQSLAELVSVIDAWSVPGR